jgi:hypothetical protein
LKRVNAFFGGALNLPRATFLIAHQGSHANKADETEHLCSIQGSYFEVMEVKLGFTTAENFPLKLKLQISNPLKAEVRGKG